MGTNYYAIPKLSDQKKAELHKAIDDNDVQALRREAPEEIHIGKSSFGWVFLFNHHDWEHFEQSCESVHNWLKEQFIYNEYGEKLSFDEFWSLVEGKKDYKSDGHMFSVDGLWFSRYTEFS